jgi:hypothetical protein
MLEENLLSAVGDRQKKAEKSKDIVDQIKNLYLRKGHNSDLDKEPLNPTRAALFGLDVRFRVIEDKLNDKRIKRSAFQNSNGLGS